jgi:5-methylcytosine-specific restriction endonuclease McrBC GTP-binding regulatory subunit McrB
MIEANNNSSKPYFLILDEMNLSHVERYFADFLSIMESGDSIKLYSGADRMDSADKPIPKEIGWPKNLFIIGTVNIDETTYMFSPKVLDRANVIEFRITPEEMKNFFNSSTNLDMNKLFVDGDKSKGGLGQDMGESFFQLALEKAIIKIPEIEGDKNILNKFFVELQNVGSEFGYRSAMEMELLITKLGSDCLNDENGNSLENHAKIDIAIMQKLLPKIHGSRKKLVLPLETLAGFCLKRINEPQEVPSANEKSIYQQYLADTRDLSKWTILYPISFEKIERMYKNVIDNGFTSYAEA